MDSMTPTKSNLMSAESSLEFSIKGYALLDKKRNVLIREMMGYVDEAEELQGKIDSVFRQAYSVLQRANVTVGISAVEDIALAIPEAEDYEISFKSVMGVAVPKIQYSFKPIEPHYSMVRSNSAVDIAYEKFNEVKYLLYELAEVENAIYRLAMEIEKTQKRANSLKNIQIPKFQSIVKRIREVLEEREREDFFRLKTVKKKKAKKTE